MLLIAAFLSVTAPARGQDSDAQAAKEVARLSQQMNDALVKDDTSFRKRFAADDCMAVAFDGHIGSKDSTFKGFKDGSLNFEATDDSEVKVRLYVDAAIVNDRRWAKTKYRGQERGREVRFTRVLLRRRGGGRSSPSRTHASRINPAGPARSPESRPGRAG
jgi:hypothetical protein